MTELFFDENFVNNQKKIIRKTFENFKATLEVHGNFEVVKWENKNGSSFDNIRFVFDLAANRMYISSKSFHSAVFMFSNEHVCFSEIAKKYACDPKMLPGFFRAIEESKTFMVYTDDFDLFKSDLEYYGKFIDFDDNEIYSKEDYEELVEDLWNMYDDCGIDLNDRDLFERVEGMTDYHINPYEWIGSVGLRVSPVVIYWLEALRIAWESFCK